MRRTLVRAGMPLALLLAATPAAAQSIHLTGLGGIHKPDTGLSDLRRDIGRVSVDDAAAFGLNLEVFGLRGSVLYAPGASVRETTDGEGRYVGESALLAAAAGIALRPLPRLFGFQPYGVAGAGIKRHGYDVRDGTPGSLPDDRVEFAIQYGLGADLMLGHRFGVVVEATNFFTVGDADFGRSASFLLAGVRMRVN